MIDLETIDYMNGKVRLQTFQPAAIDTFFEVDKSHEGRAITRIFVRGGASWDAYVTRADLAQRILEATYPEYRVAEGGLKIEMVR